MRLLLLFVLVAGCDLFATRDPAPPVEESGTYVQPDTPEDVVANVQAAVVELNAQNYRRVFADAFTFTPTAAAQAQDPSIWGDWGREEEERYFSTLVAAAQLSAGNELGLADRQESFPSEDRYELHATYQLTVNHRRPGLPATLQGRLVWVITQGSDGLWRLQQWTDQSLGNEPSWSDLKAEFVK